ncbi:MAG: tyrosine-type recombinase/integrase [Chloroflexota bacterium]
MLTEIAQFQQWLRRRSPHASTHIHYTNDIHLFYDWSGKSIAEINASDVDNYIDHCQNEGHASATINRRLAALRSLYRYLDLISPDAPPNPVLPQRHYIRRGRHLPRDVSDDVLDTLFSVIHFPRDYAMFLLMLRCGLRVGEVRNLNMHDLLLLPSTGRLPRLRVVGKGDCERVVYLSNQALNGLSGWLAVRPEVDEPAVFLNRFQRRFTVTGIQFLLAGYCQETAVWVTCHQLRHTFARHLIEASVPVTTVQRLLGHARLRTTEAYLHISDTQTQADYSAAMQILESRLGGAA